MSLRRLLPLQTVKTLFLGSEPARQGRKLASKIKWGDIRPDQPTVLVCRRSQFSKDVAELALRTKINFPSISAVKVRTFQEPWVAEADRQQTFFSTILRERGGALRETLQAFGVAFLQEASRRTPIDAVMVANLDYWQDEALKLGCMALGIPFLVLCRENYTIPWTVPWLHDNFSKANFLFDGAGVACFSEETKRAILPGMRNPDDLWVTGAPRYDRWLNLTPLAEAERSYISLITFNQPGYGAQDLFGDILTMFADAAAACGNSAIKWLVKCKKRADMDDVKARLAQASDSLEFSFDVPLFELFPKSRLVIGYNSLALIEALLTDAPIVLPWWGQAKVARSDLLLNPDDPATDAVFHIANSPDEFKALLARAAAGEDLRRGTAEQRRAIFSYHLHVSEGGNASQAVEAFIRHYVARSHSRLRPAHLAKSAS
jgi:hypothetical protein